MSAAREVPAGALAGRAGALALLSGLVLVVYAPSLGNGFVYDDLLHIVDEPVPAGWGSLARIFAEPMSPLVPYYRPLPRLLTAAQLWLHGPQPIPFHALNLALGLACAWALRALLTTPAVGVSALSATLAAALFAVHPIASECLYAAASGRETLLPTAFTLLALAAYLRATKVSRALAVVWFAFGLLSKEQAIVVPALLALADALKLAPAAPVGPRAWLARYAPFALVVAGYALAREAAVPEALTPGLALLRAPLGPLLSLLYDVQTTFAPLGRVVYEPPLEVWWSWPRLGLAAGLAAALAVSALRAAPRRAAWLLALVALSLAPTANVLAQTPAFAERWGFAALAGWLGLAGLLLDRYRPAAGRQRRVALAACAAACTLCSLLSVARAATYRDDDTFLARWRETNPRSAQAWISTGEAHERRGELRDAIAAYRRVLAADPNVALAHASIAVALAREGRLAQAQHHAERAVALDPGDAEGWSNLGGIRMRRGDAAGAVADYRRALSLRPGLASAHNNLALALRRAGDLAGARAHLEAALAANPQFAEAHANLGDLLAAQGDWEGAERHLSRALSLNPRLTAARDARERVWRARRAH